MENPKRWGGPCWRPPCFRPPWYSTNSQFGSISAVTLMFFLSYVDVLCGWLIIGSVKSNLLGTICPAIISLSTSFFSRSSKAESIGMKNVWRPGWSKRLNWFIDLTWLEKFLLKKRYIFSRRECMCVYFLWHKRKRQENWQFWTNHATQPQWIILNKKVEKVWDTSWHI